MKRTLAALGIVSGLGLVGYAIFASESEEERIRRRLEQLARAVTVQGDENLLFRRARVDREFGEVLATDVQISVSELNRSASGRSRAVELATAAGRPYRSLEVAIDPARIDVTADQAEVFAEVTVTSSSEELRREQRNAKFKLSKSADGWRIQSVHVEPSAADD